MNIDLDESSESVDEDEPAAIATIMTVKDAPVDEEYVYEDDTH